MFIVHRHSFDDDFKSWTNKSLVFMAKIKFYSDFQFTKNFQVKSLKTKQKLYYLTHPSTRFLKRKKEISLATLIAFLSYLYFHLEEFRKVQPMIYSLQQIKKALVWRFGERSNSDLISLIYSGRGLRTRSLRKWAEKQLFIA
jgi:hypothetical protein